MHQQFSIHVVRQQLGRFEVPNGPTSITSATRLAVELVRSRGRVSHRWLRRALDVSDATYEDIRFELVEVMRLAHDEGSILTLVSPGTSDEFNAAAASGLGQWRHLTFLFCDLTESTALSSRLDAEVLGELVVGHLRAAEAAVVGQGGVVARFLGDGLLAYFGWPQAHDDDAARAVRAGLDIVARIQVLNDAMRQVYGTVLPVRVGLHSGPTVISDIGAGMAREALAVGYTPNLGARVESVADPDTVCVSETTAQLVQDLFRLEDRGAFELKGLARPVHIFHVLGEHEDNTHARSGFSSTTTTPLIGRGRVRAQLRDAVERASQGQRIGLCLIGEAGIGKSRLVRDACASMGEEVLIIAAHCSRLGRHSPLLPWIDALCKWWSASGSLLSGLDAALASCGPTAPEAYRGVLAALCALEAVPAPTQLAAEELTPQRRREMTFDAVVSLVKAQASRRLVTIVIEDLHWSDPSTIALLAHVFARCSGLGVLCLLTTRPGFSALPVGVESLHLSPLGEADARSLATALAGGHTLSNQALADVAQRSGGNPLFVEELTKAAVHDESTTLGHDAAAQSREPDIPVALYAPLLARLDRIGPARHLVQVAATIGQEFELWLLRRLLDIDESTLAEELLRLAPEQLLHYRDANSWAFHHALIQEVAARTLLRREARTINELIARALLEPPRDCAPVPPERIAHHFTEAGLHAQALHWWREAGVRALHRSANVESAAHLERAIGMLPALAEAADRSAAELELRSLLAVPLTLMRGWAAPEVAVQYERAQELCRLLDDPSKVIPTRIGLQTYHIVSGRVRHAQHMAFETLALSHRCKDTGLQLEAEHDCGTTSVYLGEFDRGLRHLQRVEQLYVPERHHRHVYAFGKDPLVVAVAHQAMVHACCGRVDQALADAHRAVAHTRAWPHPFSALWAQLGVAMIHAIRYEDDLAAEAALPVIEEATRLGYPNWKAQAMTYHGLGLARRGLVDEGIAQIEEGLDGWKCTGAQVGHAILLSFLVRALMHAGRLDRAWVVAQDTLSSIERSAEAWSEPDVLRLCGEVAMRLHGDAAAEPWLRRAVLRARAQSSTTWELYAAVRLAELLRRQSRMTEAQAVLEPVWNEWREGFDAPWARAAQRCGRQLKTGGEIDGSAFA